MNRRSGILGLALGVCVVALALAGVPMFSSVSAQRRAIRVETLNLPVGVDVSGPNADPLITEWPVTLIRSARAAEPLSLLVALHGRGEAVRGPVRGHEGWLHDYALEEAWTSLERQVIPDSFRALASPFAIRRVGHRIRQRSLRSLAVALVYTPDIGREPTQSARIQAYGNYIVNGVIPELRRRFGLRTDREHTAIDGVSLGGLLALEVGLSHPETFGSVGALQPAVRQRVQQTAELMREPPQCMRLGSSDADPYLAATRELADLVRPRMRSLEYMEYRGPHAYSWNREVGSVELLSFHARCFADAH